MYWSRLLLAGLAISLLDGCATSHRSGVPAPVESRGQTIPEEGSTSGATEVYAYQPPKQVAVIRRPPSSRAVSNLMQRAAAQRRAGDIPGAMASLERALRIEPRNARLWNRLSHLYMLQNNYAQVEQLAAKSNALIQADDVLAADNWSLIARARDAQGDRQGARQARERARILQ